ncbi:Uncharacterized protein OBRU01_08805 [Operophtera brumata]|uniref:C2H2-type domain-containing protein n=1 Tax=Operophtera brumata TaxID=104452 RepID=A0A0L7LHF3_OPEBR|nr:Uncharacterized protein OBRU01_08805 [Operophtera brumata]
MAKISKNFFVCLTGICPKKLKNIDDLTNHLEHHKMAVTSDTTCGLCPEQFISLPHLLGHRMAHVPAAQKVCHICARKFMSAENLEVNCKTCRRMYASQELLDRHQCKHSPGVVCPVCGVTVRAASGTAVSEQQNMPAHVREPRATRPAPVQAQPGRRVPRVRGHSARRERHRGE